MEENALTKLNAEPSDLAEAYRFMLGWRPSGILAIRETLEILPPGERYAAMAVLACAQLLDSKLAETMLRNIAKKKPREREVIYLLARSKDPRDRTLALTTAADLPPCPDPRLSSIETALDALRRAMKPYPDDPLTPEFEERIADLKRLKAKVREVSFDAARDARDKMLHVRAAALQKGQSDRPETPAAPEVVV